MAYTFLKSKNYEIGKSLLDEESIEFCKKMLSQYPDKLILPVDHYVSDSIEGTGTLKSLEETSNNDMGLDIGDKTIHLFTDLIEKSHTVIWNGPVGLFENPSFQKGTKALCEAMKKVDGKTVVGGGDTASAVKKLGYQEVFTHISTGGGASLELLEGKQLPGINCISDK